MSQITYQHRNHANTELDVRVPTWGTPKDESQQEEFRRLVHFLRKRGWLIIAAVVVGIFVAAVVNNLKPKMYTASAQIEIVPDQSSQFRLEAVPGLSATGDVAERLDTEIQILRSRSLALQTIESMHLQDNPDFYRFNNGRPWDLSSGAARDALIGAFEGDLDVTRNGQTQLIQIKVTTRQPELSALIVNTFIDNYIERSFRDNYASTVKVSEWLSSQLKGLKDDLAKSQAQMIDDQRSLGLLGTNSILNDSRSDGGGGQNIVLSQLDEMNRSLASAEIDRIIKEAHLNAIRNSSPGVIDAQAGLAAPSLQANKQMLAQLSSAYVSMSQSYGVRYPPLKGLKAQIDQLEKNLAKEEADVVGAAQKEYDAAVANEATVRRAFEKDEQDAFAKAQGGTQFELARENYQAQRRIYDGLQERLLEAGILAGLHSTSIHIVDKADAPIAASRPRKNINIALGIGAGLLFGCGLSLLLEVLDTSLKEISDIEESLELPLLAAIPLADKKELLPIRFSEDATRKKAGSWSRVAEAMRTMRTSILLSRPGAPPKVLMMVSAHPAEGKSSIAALLSITLAMGGSRVLLVDADLRRPTLHLKFGLSKGEGLSSALSGETSVQDAIVSWTELSNLHILPSGPIPPLPSELLGSRQMEEMLKELREQYDFVVIDTPPVLTVTDASVLGHLSDATILIVRHGSVHREVERRCIDVLDRSGAKLLGVAVNVVDFNSSEYSRYYGNRYYEYIGERNPD